jgi:hydroxymethylpyrimidine pyrophosphatase-like HAD family hydrolase
MIADPYDGSYFIVQATHAAVNKGKIVNDLVAIHGRGSGVIAAGDDHNDLPMLQHADVKIAMGTAPSKLIKGADIVASSAQDLGIIDALTAAIDGLTTVV